MTTRRQTIDRIRRALAALYDTREAEQIARLAACRLGGFTLTQYVVEPDAPCDIPTLDEVIRQLADARPVQYVLGETEFCGLTFRVREGVLIPRPETEELVAWIRSEAPATPDVLDIGTGSGCIAVALALGLPGARVTALDRSREALAVARDNALRLGAAVRFIEADALQGVEGEVEGPFDIIVSNPPYVPQGERAAMHRNVRDYEPAAALFVPDDDPLRFYRAIARSARRLLRPEGRLYFEIHERFAPQLRELLAAEGFAGLVVREDLNRKPRMLCCRPTANPA